MNLFQRALLIISTVTALSWTSKVTQGALYNNLNDKALSEEQWGNAIATWWGGKDTISTTPKDPFANMSPEEVLSDIRDFLEEYNLSDGLQKRSKKGYHIMNNIIAVQHNEFDTLLTWTQKEVMAPMIEKWIIPEWKLIEEFDKWLGYFSYEIEWKKYLIVCGSDDTTDTHSAYGRLSQERNILKDLIQEVQDTKNNNKVFNLNKWDTIQNPMSIAWLLHNEYINMIKNMRNYTDKEYIDIDDIALLFRQLNTDLFHSINNIIEHKKIGDKTLPDWEVVEKRNQRLRNLNQWSITFMELWNNKDIQNLIGSKAWDIIIYTKNWEVTDIGGMFEAYIQKMLNGEDNSELFTHINNRLFEITKSLSESNNINKDLLQGDLGKKVVIDFFALRFFAWKLWCYTEIWTSINQSIFEAFIKECNNLPAGDTKKYLMHLINNFQSLFRKEWGPDTIDYKEIRRLDWIIAWITNTAELYKNVA